MNNIKKLLLIVAFIIFYLLFEVNYMAANIFVSQRSYETFAEDELAGPFLTVEFVATEELRMDEEVAVLTEAKPILNYGRIARAELSDGRHVLVIFKPFLGDLKINTPIRGCFAEIPQEVAYLTKECDVEPYVFYCFENHLVRTEKKCSMVQLLVGIAGMFVCGGVLLAHYFPKLFPALFRVEERSRTVARDSNFELLRIVCMIMIIMQHFGFWGDFDVSGSITTNTIVLQAIVNAGKIGVNCFMMITGYYSAFGTFRASKITKLVARVWFYTWTIALVLFRTGLGIRSWDNLIGSALPISSGTFWFVTIYLIVYILSPYINQVIQNIDREKYIALLAFLFVIWSVVPSFVKPGWEFTNTGWLIFMYLLGAFFKKYPNVWENCKTQPLLFYVGAYVVLMGLTYLQDVRGEMIVYQQIVAQKHTVPIVICSVALFVFFKNIHIGQNKVINKIAASTFGVYLIHENPVLNDLLWTDWLKVNTYYADKSFVWYALGAILLVYVVCTMIDMVVGLVAHFCARVVFNLRRVVKRKQEGI